MASVQYLFSQSQAFLRELRTAQLHFRRANISRIPSVLIIQKTWRGYFQWKKYQKIRNAVITIQAYFKGWRVRANKGHYKEVHDRNMKDLQRQIAAIKMQAWWRGESERKILRRKGLLAKERIEERLNVAIASQNMAERMHKMFDENERILREKEEEACRKEALIIMYKCHHLLRTYTREGIYSRHGRQKLSIIELLMKDLPMKQYMDQVHGLYKYLKKVKTYADEDKLKLLAEKARKLKGDITQGLEHKPRSMITVPDASIHDKPFILHSKICPLPYEKSITTCKSRRAKPKSQYILSREQRFMLNLKKDLKNRDAPYYIDFWENEKRRNKNSC